MGVYYHDCAGCVFGYADIDERIAYCECGSTFCSIECGKLFNHGEYDEVTKNYRIDDNLGITCKICRKEAVNDYVLFCALLKHFSLSREDAFEIYKKQKD